MSASPASRSRHGWNASAPGEETRTHPAEGRNPRSAGPDRRASAARARIRRRPGRARRPDGRADDRRRVAAAGHLRAAAHEPPDRGLRDRVTRFGIIRFPGSCDEHDAWLAAARYGEAEILWHRDRDLTGVDAVVIPGGFSYGDYLRVGAIARFSPVMEAVAEFAAAGGLVLGICNGFQVLCEAGLLPGALLRNTTLRFVFRQVDLDVVRTDTPFTAACLPGEP